MKILIAEDEAVSRRLLELVMKDWGHELTLASDGEEAFALYSSSKFDAIITDWMMPGKDGLELARAIRAVRPREYPWIVLLTAKGIRDHHEEAIAAGVDDFLEKPLDRGMLRARLSVATRVLRMRESVHALARLLPMCMHCKSVRGRNDEWETIERFLEVERGLDLSHGLCPCCYYRTSLKPAIEKRDVSAEVAELAARIEAILARGARADETIIALDRLIEG